MKHRIQITLDDKAIHTLNQQENKSQYIEDLILNHISPPAPGGLSESEVRSIVREELSLQAATSPKNIDLASLGIKTADTFVPKPPDPEKGYPCCSANSPCKHWIWDDMDTVWTNTLTGKTRES